MKSKSILFAILLLSILACDNNTEKMSYKVTKIDAQDALSSDWNAGPWKDIEPAELTRHMGERPDHFPGVQFKLAYDDEGILVKFKVADQYVKAIYTKHQGPVYKDSCVEFFFTPGTDVAEGYFNLEMNCGGTMLFHHQVEPRKDPVSISSEDLEQVQVLASLPKLVDPEITEKTMWQVSYKIPFSILEKYHNMYPPESGTVWKANFYKCGDDTSHPHWLTWSAVERPQPDFHRPEYFGEIIF